MPNSSKEPPASSKAPNEDLKDMDVLSTFKIILFNSLTFKYKYIYNFLFVHFTFNPFFTTPSSNHKDS